MNEHAMTAGLIPVRHPGLPGVVKLPRRYEKAALGDPRTARYRKVSVCAGPLQIGDGISDRLDDLMAAIMWIKQELILLRQHDILLKRQFFDIHHSIRTLQPKLKPNGALHLSPSSPSISKTATATTTTTAATTTGASPTTSRATTTTTTSRGPASTDSTPQDHASISRSPSYSPVLPARRRSSSIRHIPISISDLDLDILLVRPSSSATVLNNISNKSDRDVDDNDGDDDDTDGDDTFDDEMFRPRTSSMRTSRDLAALARRRGSKELI